MRTHVVVVVVMVVVIIKVNIKAIYTIFLLSIVGQRYRTERRKSTTAQRQNDIKMSVSFNVWQAVAKSQNFMPHNEKVSRECCLNSQLLVS